MPWQETHVVNERVKFVSAAQSGEETMEALCRRFGVSRKTGYKLLERYLREGVDGLRDRSRAPRTHPNQLSPELEGLILRARRAHPTWGSKKLLVVLSEQWPAERLPARSTIDAVLRRAGAIEPRRTKRTRRPAPSKPVIEAHEPNDVWSIDFKGWFRLGDGVRCDPLTVNDVFSRASLLCRAMVRPKLDDVRAQIERLFGKFGLPHYMLSDNGPPFGSNGLGGLSRLGVWLLRLGVRPVFIEPGRPEQNGRHERFHETLLFEAADPPRASLRAQQAAFDAFQREYNSVRPHEALGMRRPWELYRPSPRELPREAPAHEYGSGFETRSVRRDGSIKWKRGYVFVGEAMAHEMIGLESVDEGRWRLWLGPFELGMLHERSNSVVPLGRERGHGSVTHAPGHATRTEPRRQAKLR